MVPERRQQSAAAIARRAERLQAKQLIVIDAVIDIINEGDTNPSMPKIVERSGIPERSIFRYFDDIADLITQTLARAVGDPVEVQQLDNLGVGSLDERIDSFVESSVAALERFKYMSQVARRRITLAPVLAETLEALIAGLQWTIRQHFATELETMSEDEAARVTDAITVVLSADGFDVLRRRLGKSPDEIADVMRTALARLVAPR